MRISRSALTYKPEFFQNLEKVAEQSRWLLSDVLREAWLADTIVLVADHLARAVLSGGSAVRSIAKIYRITYDVDFDTQENRFEAICESLKEANKKLGGSRSLQKFKAPGCISFKPGRNVRASFAGERRLAPFVRWTSNSTYLNLHIMYVPDMPEMFGRQSHMSLESVIPLEATVPTADRKHLFYRKALRANIEARVEDFIDLTFLIDTSAPIQVQEMVEYCSERAKKAVVVRGLKNLVSKRRDYVEGVESRLTYAALNIPPNEWVNRAAQTLESFLAKL